MDYACDKRGVIGLGIFSVFDRSIEEGAVKGLVTARDSILQVQGDKVLVFKDDGPVRMLTFVHCVDEHAHTLRLVNREEKIHKPDWPVTQELWQAVQPAPENKAGAKWALEIA